MALETEISRLVVKLVGDQSSYQEMLETASSQTRNVFKNIENLGNGLFESVTKPLLAIGRESVGSFGSFNQAMTESLSIMDTTTEQAQAMEKAALRLSGRSATGPDEIAKGYYHLASAGFDAKQSMAAMPTMIQFATAGAFNLEKAVSLASAGLNSMGLASKDPIENMAQLGRVTDVLAKAANIAQGDVQEYALALSRDAGATMKQFNIDLESGVAVLAAYGQQNVKGAFAGNMYGRALRLLAFTANKNRKQHEELGFSVFDAQGKMRSMADIAQNLEEIFKGMSPEMRAATLEMLGFKALSQKAILPLVGQSQAIRDFEKNLRDAKGTVNEMATKQMQSFNNQMKMTWNSIRAVSIEIGGYLVPVVLLFARVIEKAVYAWKNFSVGSKRSVVEILALVAALAAGPRVLFVFLGVFARFFGMVSGFGGIFASFLPFMMIFGSMGKFLGWMVKLRMDFLAYSLFGIFKALGMIVGLATGPAQIVVTVFRSMGVALTGVFFGLNMFVRSLMTMNILRAQLWAFRLVLAGIATIFSIGLVPLAHIFVTVLFPLVGWIPLLIAGFYGMAGGLALALTKVGGLSALVSIVVAGLKTASLATLGFLANSRFLVTSFTGIGVALSGVLRFLFVALNPAKLLLISFQALGTLLSGGISMAFSAIGFILSTIFSPLVIGIVLLAAIVALVYSWVQSVGGLENAWNAVKEAAVTAWEWLEPVRDALAILWDSVLSAGHEAFLALSDLITTLWGDSFGTMNIDFGAWRDAVVDGILYIAYLFTMWRQVADVAWASAKYGAVSFANQIIYFFQVVLPTTFTWFKENWKEIFTDAFNLTQVMFTNLVENLKRIWNNWTALLKGDKTLAELWTPLTEGFVRKSKELIIPARQASDLEQTLLDQLNQKSGDLNAGFAAWKQKAIDKREMDKYNESIDWFVDNYDMIMYTMYGSNGEMAAAAAASNIAEAGTKGGKGFAKNAQKEMEAVEQVSFFSGAAMDRIAAQQERFGTFLSKDKKEELMRLQLEELRKLNDKDGIGLEEAGLTE